MTRLTFNLLDLVHYRGLISTTVLAYDRFIIYGFCTGKGFKFCRPYVRKNSLEEWEKYKQKSCLFVHTIGKSLLRSLGRHDREKRLKYKRSAFTSSTRLKHYLVLSQTSNVSLICWRGFEQPGERRDAACTLKGRPGWFKKGRKYIEHNIKGEYYSAQCTRTTFR